MTDHSKTSGNHESAAQKVERTVESGQRELAFYLVAGLTLVMAVIAGTIAVVVYRGEAEMLEKEIAAKTKPKPGEPGFDSRDPAAKEKEPSAVDRFLAKVVTHPWFLWSFFNFALLLAGMLTLMSTGVARPAIPGESAAPPTGPPLPGIPPVRLALALAGGLLGFTTACFVGVGYAVLWWKDLTSGGIKVWRETWPWLVVLAVIGGLMVTFGSLVTLKSEERRSPAIRRLLYGFNSVLVGFLLLGILVVANALVIWYGPAGASDWTASNIYSITAESKQLLKNLDKPVHIYVMLEYSQLYLDCKNLLDSCSNYTEQLQVTWLNPASTRDVNKFDELVKKYGHLVQMGMLVLYDPEGEVRHAFIKQTADGPDDLGLEDAPRRFSGNETPAFRGEQALMSVLRSFLEGTTKLTIYFTQDSGEMSLTSLQTERPPRFDRGLGRLKTQLEKQGYLVKEWALGAVDEKTLQPRPIPDDAFAVVIADPAPTIASKLKPLEDYLFQRQGKLIILAEPRLDSEGRVMPTGLEQLALSFGVNIQSEIILSVAGSQLLRDPTAALVMLSPGAEHSLREAIRNQLEARDNLMFRIRPVAPVAQPPAQYEVAPLLQIRPVVPVSDGRMASGQWPEPQIKGTPEEMLEFLSKPENRQEFVRRLTVSPPVVAVTVREKGESAPPAHPGLPPTSKPGAPRMVVIGDATLACNAQVQNDAEFSYNVLSSSLSWLRGKSLVLGNIKPKERSAYRPNLTLEDMSRLRWLPGTLLLLFIIAAGITVGIIRRRG